MKDIKNFQQMHRDGRINRREFLAAMSALGVSATAAGGFLTSSKALAATPKKGGLARAASNLHGPDDQMDPIVFTSGIDYTRGRGHLQQPDPDARRHGAAPRARRRMVAQRQRHRVHLQAPQGRDLARRLRLHRGRRGLEHEPASRRGFPIRDRVVLRQRDGVEEARQPHGEGDPQLSGLRPSREAQRETGQDRQEGHRGLQGRQRYRAVSPRVLRARGAFDPRPQSQLLARRAELRRPGDYRHHRSDRAGQCAHRRRHGPHLQRRFEGRPPHRGSRRGPRQLDAFGPVRRDLLPQEHRAGVERRLRDGPAVHPGPRADRALHPQGARHGGQRPPHRPGPTGRTTARSSPSASSTRTRRSSTSRSPATPPPSSTSRR